MVEERALVELAQNGDRTAFRDLVQRHQRNVYFLALDLVGNRQEAEDLVQEVFIRAYKALPKFRKEAKFGSWLYRITANCCIDSRRKNHRKFTSLEARVDEGQSLGEQLADEGAEKNPERRMTSKMIQHHIEKALNRLSPRERVVFVMRHYNDLPLKEIAAILNIAEGTVKSLLFRAIRRLQKELEFYRSDFGLDN